MLNEIKINIENEERLLAIAKALNSPNRLKILTMIASESYNISEISNALNLPMSTARLDLNILKEAGLIEMDTRSTQKGKSVIVYRTTDSLAIDLIRYGDSCMPNKEYNYTLPIGTFSEYENITAPCGMASADGFLGNNNDEAIFYSTERTKAEIIWFTSGFLEYRIKLPSLTKPIKEIEITFEACAETPLYNNTYKSDISVLLNNKAIGTWCCPGDFGGLKGQLNPSFWPSNMTQYGVLTHWSINESGTRMNNSFVGYTRISDIDFTKQPYLSIKIGVNKKATHCGGINLFGKKFGNSPTDIIVKITM